MTTPSYITFSNIIIDDIVLSDGRTFMGTLGGAGTHALIGMRVWSDRLGFMATIGPDFDQAMRAQLERLGIDMRGVIEHADYKTTRAWQLFEPDERRIEIMRTDLDDFFKYTPYFEDMPADYHQARGFHLQWGKTFDELLQLVNQLRAANPDVRLIWEPTLEFFKVGQANFGVLLSLLDIFSPDLGEAQEITQQSDPDAAAKTLLDWGATCVAVRMGAQGSLVRTSAGDGWRIPAVPPAELVDVTGAGNAYCGGFLVGVGEGLDTLEASLRAGVSASFAIEQFGVPTFDESTFAEAERRLVWVRERVEAL